MVKINKILDLTSPTFLTSLMETSNLLNQLLSINILSKNQDITIFWVKPLKIELKSTTFWEFLRMLLNKLEHSSGTKNLKLPNQPLLKKPNQNLILLKLSSETRNLLWDILLLLISKSLKLLTISQLLSLKNIKIIPSGKQLEKISIVYLRFLVIIKEKTP
jgi:hypothetical protein